MSNEHNNAPAVPNQIDAWNQVRAEAKKLSATVLAPLLAAVEAYGFACQTTPAPAPAPAPAQGEPFGYFRAEPFGWTDCSEDAEGAIALYEHPAKPARECGNCFEGRSDMDHDCPKCGGTGFLPAQEVGLTASQFDLICQAIDKADTATMDGDYMLDSDDCIAVVRVMQALFDIAALRAKGGK